MSNCCVCLVGKRERRNRRSEAFPPLTSLCLPLGFVVWRHVGLWGLWRNWALCLLMACSPCSVLLWCSCTRRCKDHTAPFFSLKHTLTHTNGPLHLCICVPPWGGDTRLTGCSSDVLKPTASLLLSLFLMRVRRHERTSPRLHTICTLPLLKEKKKSWNPF